MAVQFVEYKKTLDGSAPEIRTYTVGATAVKMGDPVKVGAAANLVIPITAAGDVVRGVALHDAAISGTVSVVQATDMTVFKIKCSATKKYVASADMCTQCDFDTFTSGAMSIDPATDVSHSVFLYDLSPDSVDNTNANYVLAIFNLRNLGK